MKYILGLILSFGLFGFASAQDDTTAMHRSQDQITCAYIDNNTLACYSPVIDTDNDGIISADEWNEADVSDRGIIEADNIYNEDEVFEEEGLYDYNGLYDYGYDYGIGDYGYDEYGYDYDTDVFDSEEDGAFQ